MDKITQSPLFLIGGLILLAWGGVQFVETAVIPRLRG